MQNAQERLHNNVYGALRHNKVYFFFLLRDQMK